MKKKNAIKIDVVNQTLSYVVIEKFRDIYDHIGNGCDLFCAPFEFENGDTIYADDEGLLKGVFGGFIMNGWAYPICSNCVIQGVDNEGDSTDCKTTIEELLPQIIWLSKEDAEEWQLNVMLRGCEIYYK